MTFRLGSLLRAPGLSLAVAIAFFSTVGPGRAAFAQDYPGDDAPTRSATPTPPAPPAGPAAGSAPAPQPDDGTKLRPGEAVPPLPPGTVAAPGYPSAPRYKLRYEERRMTGLMAAGIGIFAGTYLLTAVFGGYVTDHGYFAVPVVGPIIYKSDDKAQEAALVLDTIVQAGGIAMAIAGAFVKQRVAVREPITLVPITVPGGGGGLAATGTW